ncbi:DUF1572 family protein [Winogradskyella sp.]|uniref:DUF1572 family protein n=1 Tax=Winogradskyella sp. TaxID=1883156 RepID=UPI003F6AFB6B
MSSYLNSVLKQFTYHKSLGDKTIAQLKFDDLQKETVADANSISIIVKHLAGNMLSRWTNFLTEDGEKEWRNRDEEFVDSFTSKQDLLNSWQKGWQCLFIAIEQLSVSELEQIIFIRNQGHTVTEAINRQMMHYAYHVGQIVYIGKLIKDKEWESLSIPKGQSKDYNNEKFSKTKGKRHFTEDL